MWYMCYSLPFLVFNKFYSSNIPITSICFSSVMFVKRIALEYRCDNLLLCNNESYLSLKDLMSTSKELPSLNQRNWKIVGIDKGNFTLSQTKQGTLEEWRGWFK